MRYNWEISDLPICGDAFDVDHVMICRRGGFVIQRHNEIRNLEAELLGTVCKDVEVEPLIHPLMQVLTYMPEVSGSDRGLHILMSGYATHIHIVSRHQSKRKREKEEICQQVLEFYPFSLQYNRWNGR